MDLSWEGTACRAFFFHSGSLDLRVNIGATKANLRSVRRAHEKVNGNGVVVRYASRYLYMP
jgi:hypothetical protein